MHLPSRDELTANSSTTSSSCSTPSTPQLPSFATGSRNLTFPSWDSPNYTPEMDGRPQGGFEVASSSSQGSFRSASFTQLKRANPPLSRQFTAPPSPTTASSSLPGTPHANAHADAVRPKNLDGPISAIQLEERARGRDVREELTSALNILRAERWRLPVDEVDAPHDDSEFSTSHTRVTPDPQPPSPTMTVFSSLDDDLLPDFLDFDDDDASKRLSHLGSRPFSILPGVAEVEYEHPPRAHENTYHPRTASMSKPHNVPLAPSRKATAIHNGSEYGDPVIPVMHPPPGPRKAQSLSNLTSRRGLHNRSTIQQSGSLQRPYELSSETSLGGSDFPKPRPLAQMERVQQHDEDGHTLPSPQRSQTSFRARRVSPLSPVSESHSPPVHLGVPLFTSEPSPRLESRPRAMTSVSMQSVDNAQRRLHHSASRESGFTGTEGSSRSRSSTTSSWDFASRGTPDPAIPPELAASRIPGVPSMLSPATRQNFSSIPSSESSRPGVQRILQQHGMSAGRGSYSPTALSPTAPSFDQSISRRGSTRSGHSNVSSGSSQNVVDSVQPRRRDEGSGLSDLRHKISGLLRPAQDISPRSSDFDTSSTPGTPRRRGKGNDDVHSASSPIAGIGGLSLRSRGLSMKTSEQLAPPQSPRAITNARQSSTTVRSVGSTSPQPEESFMPDELIDKPLKKKLFGGLGW